MEEHLRILGIAPYRGMAALMKQCADCEPSIRLDAVFGNMQDGLALAKARSRDYDIIISRANTASLIESELSIPVIDIGISYYDVLRCIKIAEKTGTKFALLGFQTLTSIAKKLCDLLQLDLDIYSFSARNWNESDRILDQLKASGYETVICDTIPYEHAKLIGITPILLTSSAESIRGAISRALSLWHKTHSLLRENTMLRCVVGSSSNRYLVLSADGTCLYSTLDQPLEQAFRTQLKSEHAKCFSMQKRSFFLTIGGQLYSVYTTLSQTAQQSPYLIVRIAPSRIPPVHSKYGIAIMDEQTALQSFTESFYSNTELARDIIQSTKELENAAAPLMITGEVGVGKDRVAHIYYAKSSRNHFPLYIINCAMINEKTWSFVTNHYNSPFTDNGNTIYISNLEALSRAQEKFLLSLILDTNLHVRNRLIFSCTQQRNKPIPHVALEYSNMLGCIPISIKPLREQKEDLVSSASLYIDSLNQTLGKQVVGLEDGAAALLEVYDYPCNRTQFKRILKKAVLHTESAYISENTIRQILEQETAFFAPGQTAHAAGRTFPSPKGHAKSPKDVNAGLGSGSVPGEGIPLEPSGCVCEHNASAPASPLLDIDLEQTLDEMNRDIIRYVLERCGGNQTLCAKRLGISRTTLWRYLNR